MFLPKPLAAAWQNLQAWQSRRSPTTRTSVRLDRRHIYILPTGFGYVFTLLLGILLLWSINYNNSLGFVLTFLLAAAAVQNAMWRTHLNLLNLCLSPGNVEPVFVGQDAGFTIRVENPDPQPRYGVALKTRDGQPSYFDALANTTVTVAVPARQRGLLRCGRVQVTTRFPLGLFEAWSWVEFEQTCLVYPRPAGTTPLPLLGGHTRGGNRAAASLGSDDYAGLRPYVPGDSPRHIAWKAAARTDKLLVKRFTDQASVELWLDWQLLTPAPVEVRLSQLCQWVLKAETDGRDYGLRLPNLAIAPGRGEAHRRRCLEALALFPNKPGNPRG